jgi:thiamine-phosphate pyrophosphorylase
VLLYYITDRTQFSGGENQRRVRLLDRMAEAARCGIDFVQLREKDLPARDLESLAQSAVEIVRASGSSTRLLINSRTDVALAVGAHGVHLRSHDISPADVRKISWEAEAELAVGVSCHTEQDVTAARDAGAQFVVFGPVFEKPGAPESAVTGIARLRSACRQGIPVLALGGITVENAASCIEAGAAGVAGVRLFQEGELEKTAKTLREL